MVVGVVATLIGADDLTLGAPCLSAGTLIFAGLLTVVTAFADRQIGK